MRKKVLIPSLIATVLIAGVIVTQVYAIKQDKPLANPATIDQPMTNSKDQTEPVVVNQNADPSTNRTDVALDNQNVDPPKGQQTVVQPQHPPVKPPVEVSDEIADNAPGAQENEPSAKAVLSSQLANNLPSKTISNNEDGLAVITNTTSTFVLVNKKRNLPSTYVPEDLVVPKVPFSFSGDSPKKQLRKEAAKALEALFAAAEQDDIKIFAVSGYRSYVTQKAIFASYAKREGEEVANRTSAHPGQSEHQTGLAMDISSASVKYALKESFGETKEGKWLAKHAAEHGFIIRYLKGKEDITGYSYEPWHVRYVGKEAAQEIAAQEVTLEQYFEAVAVSLEGQ